MAQLKDSVVQGSLRATDSLLATTGQFKILNAPNGSNSTTYSAGSSGQVLRSNGSSAYWGALSTSDLGSGTLPVSRGGTGITTSTTKNAVIIGNSSTVTNAFQAIQTKNGAFYATATDGAPSFGTLPIAQGGTGKTNKDDAIAALGGVKKAGDTMTGTLTVKGLKGSSGTDYGTSLPSSPAEGQMFFQISDPWYELPAGGTAGQVLMKNSNSNYDVKWGGGSVSLDSVYPIGSIYMNINLIDPNAVLGGSWQRLEDTFLLAAGSTYAGNTSGGSATHTHTTANHTLVESEVPKHSHSRGSMNITGRFAMDPSNGWIRVRSDLCQGAFYGSGGEHIASGGSDNGGSHNNFCNFDASRNWSGSTSEYGGNGAHNHGDTGSASSLPPYITVYMWQRTA